MVDLELIIDPPVIAVPHWLELQRHRGKQEWRLVGEGRPSPFSWRYGLDRSEEGVDGEAGGSAVWG